MASRDAAPPEPEATQRLDKWLWFARVVKTRTLAAGLVENGKVRVNRQRVDKPSHGVRSGDVITVTAHRQVRVLKVVAPGLRRGPPTEARSLFEDLSAPRPPGNDGTTSGTSPDEMARAGTGERSPASAPLEPSYRPDKRGRRALIALKRPDADDD